MFHCFTTLDFASSEVATWFYQTVEGFVTMISGMSPQSGGGHDGLPKHYAIFTTHVLYPHGNFVGIRIKVTPPTGNK